LIIDKVRGEWNSREMALKEDVSFGIRLIEFGLFDLEFDIRSKLPKDLVFTMSDRNLFYRG